MSDKLKWPLSSRPPNTNGEAPEPFGEGHSVSTNEPAGAGIDGDDSTSARAHEQSPPPETAAAWNIPSHPGVP